MKPRKRWAKIVRGFHAIYGVLLFAICIANLYCSWAWIVMISIFIINVVLYTKYDGCVLTLLAEWLEREGV